MIRSSAPYVIFQIVFSVSYFFDKDHYENPDAFAKIAPDVQLHNYVACGLIAYNLQSRKMLWQLHLDLTTDLTKFRAFVYSNPVVADLDGDGKLEILVGTSVGFIYVVNSDGKVRKGFPLQMGEIQASITVHDLNGDGQLEIIAADSRHNIAAFHSNGENLWHRHVSGFVSRFVPSCFYMFLCCAQCTILHQCDLWFQRHHDRRCEWRRPSRRCRCHQQRPSVGSQRCNRRFDIKLSAQSGRSCSSAHHHRQAP
jgi:hypothetical protein